MSEWICTNCGAQYESHNPPCRECAGENIVKLENISEPQQIERSDSLEWKCKECGERHIKNNPPCKNCGNMAFEQVKEDTENEIQEAGIPSTNRRSLLIYIGIIGAVLTGGYYLFSSGNEYPTTTAPGMAEEASGIRFQTAETEFRAIINDERESEGLDTLLSAENLEAFATYLNKEYVKAGSLEDINPGAVNEQFDASGGRILGNRTTPDSSGRAIDSYESASELAQAFVSRFLSSTDTRQILMNTEYSVIGVDIHVDQNGDVFVIAVVN